MVVGSETQLHLPLPVYTFSPFRIRGRRCRYTPKRLRPVARLGPPQEGACHVEPSVCRHDKLLAVRSPADTPRAVSTEGGASVLWHWTSQVDVSSDNPAARPIRLESTRQEFELVAINVQRGNGVIDGQ